MSLPTNVFMWTMACLPIIVLLVLMLKFRWGATEAAPIGVLITAVTGIVFYKADISVLAVESAKGVWSAFVILLIIWTAILMYLVADEAKAFLVIRNGMKKFLPNELLLVLAMGWIFESFLQGITGFGVPVAVGAPLLIGIGVKPIYAVIIPLLGQAWGNTFGTLAAAWDALASSTGLIPGDETYLITAIWAAIFLWIWNVVTGFAICWFYGKGKAIKNGFAAVIILSLVQGGGELLLVFVNTTIANFLPACISLVVILLLGRTKLYNKEWKIEDSGIMDRSGNASDTEKAPENMSLFQAFVPYVILTAMALVVLLVTPINNVLSGISFGFAFPETSTGYGVVNAASESYSPLAPFTHASMFLLLASVIGLYYYKSKGWILTGGTAKIFKKSGTMTIPSGIAVIGLIIMSKIMGGTGQTIVLAQGIAAVLGEFYAFLCPIIGLTGSFMTGSNVSSNVLFGEFQRATSDLLGLNTPAVLGAQTTGAAIGSAISPSKIILGTTTAGILGMEGDVLKKLIPTTLGMAACLGILVYFATGIQF